MLIGSRVALFGGGGQARGGRKISGWDVAGCVLAGGFFIILVLWGGGVRLGRDRASMIRLEGLSLHGSLVRESGWPCLRGLGFFWTCDIPDRYYPGGGGNYRFAFLYDGCCGAQLEQRTMIERN